ncbi:hypothetical protein ACFYMW_20050 [Streptomyces sp. NPDC006692]|uniref:hypothetical protein n=1 Tax=Streptomyces sp. NPDC006692 TaxID=3364758 RepID=UPI00367D9422
MKQWDYVAHRGRTGLVTMDLDDMKRVAFLPPERPGELREATFRNGEGDSGRAVTARAPAGCRIRLGLSCDGRALGRQKAPGASYTMCGAAGACW